MALVYGVMGQVHGMLIQSRSKELSPNPWYKLISSYVRIVPRPAP